VQVVLEHPYAGEASSCAAALFSRVPLIVTLSGSAFPGARPRPASWSFASAAFGWAFAAPAAAVGRACRILAH